TLQAAHGQRRDQQVRHQKDQRKALRKPAISQPDVREKKRNADEEEGKQLEVVADVRAEVKEVRQRQQQEQRHGVPAEVEFVAVRHQQERTQQKGRDDSERDQPCYGC